MHRTGVRRCPPRWRPISPRRWLTLTAPEADKKRVLFVLSTQGGKINASGTGTAGGCADPHGGWRERDFRF